MNSIILASFVALCTRVCEWFKVSVIGKVFFCVYNAVSKWWSDSIIVTKLRKNERNYVEKSVLAKVLRLPFAFADFFRAKFGSFIEKNIRDSVLCNTARVYVNNFIAINTRFFGIILLCTGLGYTVAKLLTGSGIIITGIIASALGAVMIIFNFNIMRFLNNSIVCDFIKNCAGFKGLNLEVYNEEDIKGSLRLAVGAVVGLVSGFLLSIAGIWGALIPFALFGMLLVLYIPVTGVFFAVFAAPFVPTMVLAGLTIWTLLSLVIKSVTDKNFKWKMDSVGVTIILLIAILFVSSLLSFAVSGSLKVWAMYFVFLGFYFVILNTVETKEQLYGLLKVFVISGALVALYGVMQYAFGWTTANAWIDEEMFEEATMRVYSTLGNPNVLGEFLLLVLPVSAVWFLHYKTKEISKWTYTAMFLVLALCLVLTQSRGCWIGFILSVFVFVTFYEGKLWGLIPAALCILPFVIPETMIDRFMSIGNMDDTSTSYRVYIWMGTLGLLKHYWLGGIGMGEAAFNEVYPFFSYNAIQAPHSHNLYLQLTVEGGLGALIVFIAMQAIFAKKMSDVYRLNDKKSLDSSMVLALASGVIGFLAQSMFDYTFYNYRVMAIFFMVLAMGACFINLSREETRI